METVLNLYKRIGETPLECIERFKKENPSYEDLPMTYAGRLDPMAEGVLPVLAGDAVHDKEQYLKLSKTYVAHALFCVSTDSYDVLGLSQIHECRKISEEELLKIIEEIRARKTHTYPPFSSKPVAGKPLWKHAREGTLDEQKIPEREIEIRTWAIKHRYNMSSSPLLASIEEKISKVTGDFRQGEILERWQGILRDENLQFQVVVFELDVSGGTYIRSLIYELGKEVETGACIYSLVRTRVGEMILENSVQ